MTPLQWALLCVLFILYLLFGGSVFMYFEQHVEIQRKDEVATLKKDIKEVLFLLDHDFYKNDTPADLLRALIAAKLSVIHRISDVCDTVDLAPDDILENTTSTTPVPLTPEQEERLKWNFYNSVFFAFTVITTIGYGHLSPSSKWSKWFVMAYALIGIPINSILLSGIGDYFGSKLIKVHKKSKEKPERKITFVLEIILYLIPGFIVFIILPAGIFVIIEKWNFLDSVYYAFVSLTTIGFGDYVAGMGDGHTAWMMLYKVFIIIWITFGLGYLIMILGFISKGLTHKRVRVVIEKRLNTIRTTKEKLTRDIDYMRRVVNELYLMKVRPVYDTDSDDDFKERTKRVQSSPCIGAYTRRASSFPHLNSFGTGGPSDPIPIQQKGVFTMSGGSPHLSNHHHHHGENRMIVRRLSESDLEKIDRDKTFESAIRQQVTVDELLLSVVTALSGNVMGEVMEAVEELNECEEEILHGESAAGREGTFQPASPRLHDRRDFDHLPPWDLGALSESDEEVLIGDEDDADGLRQVVVEGHAEKETSTGIMGRVSGAIRKISAGSRTGSEPSSRKVSRNESTRRKISRNESFERKHGVGHHSGHKQYMNPLAYPHHHERKISQQRKISEESRISNVSSRSRLTDIIANTHGYGSNASSRKISPAYGGFPGFSSTASSRKMSPAHIDHDHDRAAKISLESTSLADFLHALDNVHSRLTSKTSVASSINGEATFSDDDHGLSVPRLSVVRRSARKRSAMNGQPGGTAHRRRKVGMVHPHPNFAYNNDSFMGDEPDNPLPTTSKDNNRK